MKLPSKMNNKNKSKSNFGNKLIRIIKGKYFISALCLIMALGLSFGLLPLMYAKTTDTTTVLRAAKTINQGEKITEAHLQMVGVSEFNLPDDILASQEEVIGNYAKDTIYGGDYFTKEKLSSVIGNKLMLETMESGKKLVTVTIHSMASGAANNLKANDIVSVAKFVNETGVIIIPELKDVKVYGIENEHGVTKKDQEEFTPKTITLIVDDAQAQKLIGAEYGGKLHLIWERRGN